MASRNRFLFTQSSPSYTYTAYSQTSPKCTHTAQSRKLPTPPHFALNLRHPQFASSRARLVAANSRPACRVRLGTSLVAARPHLKHTNAKHERTEHREYGTTESVRAVASPAPIPRAQHHGFNAARECVHALVQRVLAFWSPCTGQAPRLSPTVGSSSAELTLPQSSLPNQLGCPEADWAGTSSSVSHFSWREKFAASVRAPPVESLSSPRRMRLMQWLHASPLRDRKYALPI
ncbi:hypothetical protein C8R43DRAFT_1142918 [Mycena crocata]|nr:hypothetical protein C8R43DRAFT_1142911 [Mycena crocata]KAJ7081693.1 hypothetical protein C8R43DRAFT_1142918 [Mycena crocata]